MGIDQIQPLVSCIMPTANRRVFVPQAIRYFLAQDYENKELVIVDDGSESVADLIPDDPQVHYLRLERKVTLGEKRNECVRACRGELIMHWDDDDWMAPHRISYQVEHLLQSNAEVCGLRKMLFYNPVSGEVWLYQYPSEQRPWLAGGSLLYTRDFWQRVPFPHMQVGSDTRFILSRQMDRYVALPDYTFYVALIHSKNTSRKQTVGAYWKRWAGNLQMIMGEALDYYRVLAPSTNKQLSKVLPHLLGETPKHSPCIAASNHMKQQKSPTYSILMVTHNTHEITKLSTLRTLKYSAAQNAQLIIVDNASSDGTLQWLRMLAQRGDIELLEQTSNSGHGPSLELARKGRLSPYLVTLDSDAFPLSEDWLPQMRSRLNEEVKVVGIRHHRDYIHPSCLMIERRILEELKLTFLNEKDQPSRFDVAERISTEVKRQGYKISSLERTTAQRRGSVSEPVYLGSEYEGLVYHHWYTTRQTIAAGGTVDDVPSGAIEQSLDELISSAHNEPREITVIMGVRNLPKEPERVRNALVCLEALNLQDLERWRYRIVVIEQDTKPKLTPLLAPLADRYVFIHNQGPYNRGWAFNVGACLPSSRSGILCLIDADLLVAPDFLRRGLETFQSGCQALLPYSEVAYLNASPTEKAIADWKANPGQPFKVEEYGGQVFTSSEGGALLIDAALYRQIGGHDERFRGWGREDREFLRRLKRCVTVKRWPDRMLHLHHPRPVEDDKQAQLNQRLYEQIASTSASEFIGPIGNPDKYSGEDAHVISKNGLIQSKLRDWENWNRWEVTRIEGIVRNEQRCPVELSSRRRLAEILVCLGDSLLDVGCGPGALWPHLKPFFPRFSWAGVDVTWNMVTIAQRLFPDIPVYKASADNLPFADQSFELVLLRHVLEHLPQWLMERVLAETMRIAKRAVVVDFYIPPVAEGSGYSKRVGENFLETCWSENVLAQPIGQAGWQIEHKVRLQGKPSEKDLLWILTPKQNAIGNQSLKISVIMPTYQRSHTLSRTVAQIQAQTYSNWELIIVDNYGKDNFRFHDPRISVYHHTEFPSASYARNQGLQYAIGDLVCFFDDDDDMFPTYLERFAHTFAANPQVQMVRCGMIAQKTVNFSLATPECCLRRPFATPSWTTQGPGQDQRYFKQIIARHGWSEGAGDIVMIREALCRANADPNGGLRSGKY